MCGLAAIFDQRGRTVDTADVAAMTASLAHRGPDGDDVWQDGPVAFGHRRLAILDLSERAAQPMLTPDGQGVLVYNGQVYNYSELRAELEAEGIVFRSTGDTEVVLQALHQWGPDVAVPRFDGMFGLAYFDRRCATLWLARDRFGIKPLVTANVDSTLLVASEVKALLAHPRMPRRMDRLGLTQWLIRPTRPAHELLWSDVENVDAGSWWKITSGKVEKCSYFNILDRVDADRLIASNAVDLAGLTRQADALISASVARQLVSDVPLAAACSGGVDSSLATAYAAERQPEITAYVADLAFAGGEGDQAEQVGKHVGIPVRRVSVDRERYLRLWPHVVWQLDEPASHWSDPAVLALTRACHRDGIKVLVTGEGSDELFGGYGSFLSTYRHWRSLEWPWRLLLPTARMRRLHAERLSALPFSSSDGYAPGLQRRLAIALEPGYEFLAQTAMARLAAVEPPSDRAFLAHCLVDITDTLSGLLHRHDRLGMASSIEMREPYLGNDVADFAFHLPRKAKLRAGTSKWIIKKAAVRKLPRSIVHAKKKGFPVPRDYAKGTEKLIPGGALASEMEWSAEATADILGALGENRFLRFLLVGTELWLRIFFRGEQPDELGERLVELAV